MEKQMITLFPHRKSKLYQQLVSIFPTGFYQTMQKASVYTFAAFLTVAFVYLIVAIYLQNTTVWTFLVIPVAALLFVPLCLILIQMHVAMHRFQKALQKQAAGWKVVLPKKFIINKRALYQTKGYFVFNYLDVIYLQIIALQTNQDGNEANGE